MVPISRRRFVAVGSVAAIAGCLARGNSDSSDENDEDTNDGSGDGELPDDLSTALDPIPAAVDEVPVGQLSATALDPESDGTNTALVGINNAVDLDPQDVDWAATAMFGEDFDTVSVYVGSFEADQIDQSGNASITVEDGRAIVASSTRSAWEAGLEASEEAADDPDTGVDGEYPMEHLFGPMVDADVLHALTDIREETVPEGADIDVDALDAIGIGVSNDVEAREQTLTYVAVFAEGEEPDGAIVEEILRTDSYDTEPADAEIQVEDRRATTTITTNLPRSSFPDNSPEVYVSVRFSETRETTELQFDSSEGETVDTSNLELLIDGETVEPPWDDGATIEPDTSFEIDAQPLELVTIVWHDPEHEDISQTLARSVVDRHGVFSAEYDEENTAVTVTYDGERTADPSRLELERSTQGEPSGDSTPLTEYVDDLEPGDEFVVEDVDYGDTVSIHVDDDTDFSAKSLFYYRVSPPGSFELTQEDGERALVYHGEGNAPAAEFRVLVDDEPTDAQFADVAETLEGRERLVVDAELGDQLTVEYVGQDDPVEVFTKEVVPAAEFTYDAGDEAVEITHDGGESIPVADLGVYMYPAEPRRRPDAFASEYDTVEEGDSITVEYVADGSGEEDPEQPTTIAVSYDGNSFDVHYEPDESSTTSGSDSASGEGSAAAEDSGSGGGSGSTSGSGDGTQG